MSRVAAEAITGVSKVFFLARAAGVLHHIRQFVHHFRCDAIQIELVGHEVERTQ